MLKLNAYYAFPALSNGQPQEPYVSTCLTSARALAGLNVVAGEIGYMSSSTPLFIWASWVAARVLFGELIFMPGGRLSPNLLSLLIDFRGPCIKEADIQCTHSCVIKRLLMMISM